MNHYLLTVLSAGKLQELSEDVVPGVPTIQRCESYYHGSDTFCGIERDQMFQAVPIVDHHNFEAWDDDEATRMGASLIGSKYGETSMARLFRSDSYGPSHVADFDGTRNCRPIY